MIKVLDIYFSVGAKTRTKKLKLIFQRVIHLSYPLSVHVQDRPEDDDVDETPPKKLRND
jgi:hypothetical protein